MKRISLVIFIAVGFFATVNAQKKSIEFENIYDGTFTQKGITNIRWMNDGKFYTESRGAQIIQSNILEEEELVIFDGAQFSDADHPNGIVVQGYQFSADEKKILIRTDVRSIWRRSTKENYYVYDREAGSLTKLTDSNGDQQNGQLSPQGDKAAFMRDNNLFWVDLSSGNETQITDDGEFNAIINGGTDWVYEEEFAFTKAWEWSPNGNRIAFYRFDETDVKQFDFRVWGDLYPGKTEYKYPKAGEDNALVTIHVYDLETSETTPMDIGEETDQYIPRIQWSNNSNLLTIRRMNRLQNKEELLFADAGTGETNVILSEEVENGWIDVQDNLYFLANGKQFLYTSEKDGYNHIYLYDMQGVEKSRVTQGEWEVTQFLGVDERRHMVYFMSTEVSSMGRHMYTVRVDGKRKRQLTKTAGWHNISLSKDFKYYIDTHSSTASPNTYTLYDIRGRVKRVLEDNSELKETLEEYAYSPKEFFTIEGTDASFNAYMIKPIDFDSTEQYPVLMYVYGGPGSQTVTSAYESGDRAFWHQYLANQGYIIVSVDNRGTGGKGRDFEQTTYKRLGIKEAEDQAIAARYLASLAYVDGSRIGIWGWSYGGFMSTLSLAEGKDVFSMAIAVAPVTSWRYYDTIYTERYMQTPQLNPEGYDNGAPLNRANEIEGKYFLIHGTGDDNVHYQNAVSMVSELIDQNIQFDTFYYPNRAHSISGGNTRQHLYTMMAKYILKNL